jgi:hypothetical protein
MKTWGNADITPPFLNSALHGGDWSASSAGRLNAGKRAPGSHWTGNCVGLRPGLDPVDKSFAPARDRNPAINPFACRYTDWTLKIRTAVFRFMRPCSLVGTYLCFFVLCDLATSIILPAVSLMWVISTLKMEAVCPRLHCTINRKATIRIKYCNGTHK